MKTDFSVQIKRVYEPPTPGDGRRVLVDRLWPRGLKKEQAAIDAWLKEVAPSTTLRQWFRHDVQKWPEFKRRYFAELAGSPQVEELRQMAQAGPLTLLYAARDEAYNNAVALQEYLQTR